MFADKREAMQRLFSSVFYERLCSGGAKGVYGGHVPPFEACPPFGPHLSFTDIKQNAVYG